MNDGKRQPLFRESLYNKMGQTGPTIFGFGGTGLSGFFGFWSKLKGTLKMKSDGVFWFKEKSE